MEREQGSIVILEVVFMMSIVLTLILALELSCIYAQKSSFDNILGIAREETCSPGFDMQLKSSDNPGQLICDKISRSLRRNGYSGAITLWFYEATDEEIERANPLIDDAENVRCLAYHVVLEHSYTSAMGPAAWFADTIITNGTTAALCPYAQIKTYKPEGVSGKVWCFTVPSGSIASDGCRESSLPMTPGLSKAVRASLEKPTEIYKANQ